MAGTSAKRQLDVDPVKDDSTLGRIAVLGLMGSTFAWIGVTKTLAVMLPTLQDQFNAQTWLVGWMIAIIDGVMDLTGLFSSPLVQQFGVRAVVTVCGMTLGVSIIVSSFTTNLSVMTMVLAGFAAPAIGISYVATRALIGQCFNTSYTRAIGIGFLGNTLAFLIFLPLAQFFLDVYGWRGALKLIGAVLSNLAVCGALLKSRTETRGRTDRHTGYEPIPLEREERRNDDRRDGTCRSLWASISRAFHLDLFASSTYWLLTLISICLSTSAAAWTIYFSAHTNQSKGFSLADVATFIAMYGVGNAVGSFVVGFFDNSEVLLGNSIIGTSVCLLIDPWLTSYWPIMVNTAVYGCFHSFICALFDVVTKTSIGVDRLSSAFGWMALKCGICRLLILFFPGLIYDTLGSYTVAFIVTGVVNALALPALLVLAWIQRKK